MGHLILAGLVAELPAWIADRIMTTATLAGLAAATLWLRFRVAGTRGLVPAALLSVLLAMNFAWLMGFTSFLIGCCLFPITLGVWWEGRYRLSPVRIGIVSALLCVGYFCHLVSLGATVLGLVVLAVFGPLPHGDAESWKYRLARLSRTSMSFMPLFVLGFFYLQDGQAQRTAAAGVGEAIESVVAGPWKQRLGWVDPITLAVKDGMPFTDRVSQAFIVFALAVWLTVGLVLWWYGRMTTRTNDSVERLSRRRCRSRSNLDQEATRPAGLALSGWSASRWRNRRTRLLRGRPR